MEKWLLDSLIAKGVLTPAGIGRRAHVRRCRDCGRYTFVGLDDVVMAGVATVDVAPLDALGELLALLCGLTTYDLSWRGDRYEIDRRESHHIRSAPPGSKAGNDVVNDHRCGVDIAHHAASRLRIPSAYVFPDKPPF